MPYRNADERRANANLYRERNRERISAYHSNWKKVARRKRSSPQGYMKFLFYGIAYRKWEGDDLVLEDLYDLYKEQGGRCALTGFKMTYNPSKEFLDTNISADRIDNKKGYRKGNVRLVCRRMNVMRMDLTDSALREWCHLVLFGPEDCWHVPDDCSVSI